MPRGIPDNPAISRAERNGYEPWLYWGYETEEAWVADQEDDDGEFGEEDDPNVFFGNQTGGF